MNTLYYSNHTNKWLSIVQYFKSNFWFVIFSNFIFAQMSTKSTLKFYNCSMGHDRQKCTWLIAKCNSKHINQTSSPCTINRLSLFSFTLKPLSTIPTLSDIFIALTHTQPKYIYIWFAGFLYISHSLCMISFLFHSLFHWLPVCKTTYGVFQLPSDSLCRILFPSLSFVLNI